MLMLYCDSGYPHLSSASHYMVELFNTNIHQEMGAWWSDGCTKDTCNTANILIYLDIVNAGSYV